MTSKKGLQNLKKMKQSNKIMSPKKEKRRASETLSPYFLASNKQNNAKSNEITLLKNENEKMSIVKGKNSNYEIDSVHSVLVSKIKSVEWEPPNWKEILDNIRTMRSQISAPVDTMGCHRCIDETTTEKEKRFNILLALMLSPRTKDEITYEVMGKLKREVSPLSPANILQIEGKNLEQLLKPVAFYKNKAKFIIKTSEILVEKYDSDIPESANELMDLPGISSKIAHICMNAACNIVTGIGVDTHVHRISNRLMWVKNETKTAEKTRIELESWAPKELWGDINHLLVGFGQTICKAINPKCNSCLNNQLCPYNISSVKNKTKKVKKNIEW